jgi:hypothetical protein
MHHQTSYSFISGKIALFVAQIGFPTELATLPTPLLWRKLTELAMYLKHWKSSNEIRDGIKVTNTVGNLSILKHGKSANEIIDGIKVTLPCGDRD